MSRRKISSPRKLQELWEDYKIACNNHTIRRVDFSAKLGEHIVTEVPASVTYTIKGFCVWVGIARSSFYDSYEGNDAYSDIIAQMRAECEIDVRAKLEMGVIPTQLAPLWMSKYGYTTKTEVRDDTSTKREISAIADMASQMQKPDDDDIAD